MKPLNLLISFLTLGLAASQPAFAASTTTVYSSGILVLLFVGFCALVIVVQMIPALLTLWGMIIGLFTSKPREEVREIDVRK